MRTTLGRIADYLLGFVALTVFSWIVFAQRNPTEATWERAFLIGGGLAVVELAFLAWRTKPTNRLILGANLWLAAGAGAFLTKQWWWLKLYQSWGPAGLVGSMVVVGIVATALSPVGFVGEHGSKRAILAASLVLLAGSLVALAYLIWWNTSIRAAWAPIFCLAIANHALRALVRRSSR